MSNLNQFRVSTVREKVRDFFLSSPEPKAHGKLIVWYSSRHPCVHASVCACIHIFKDLLL